MSKLYFKYGAMGSSKTASLLITKFNYEEKGFQTLLLKPLVDDRYGETQVMSRVGLHAEAVAVSSNQDILKVFEENKKDVVLVDEAQFLTEEQVDQLHDIVDLYKIPVICYGLLTDFTTHLFPGSKRLVEIAESMTEIKTVCRCGRKATVNARIGADGRICKAGEQILIGGDESYQSMCYRCWREKTRD